MKVVHKGPVFDPFYQRPRTDGAPRTTHSIAALGKIPSSTSSAGQNTFTNSRRVGINKGSMLSNLSHYQVRPDTGNATGNQQVQDFQDAGIAASQADASLAVDKQNAAIQQAQEQARQQAISNNMANERQEFQTRVRNATSQQGLLADLRQHQQNQMWGRKNFFLNNLLDY